MFFTNFCFKISLGDTSFYISLNYLGFYLSRILVEFSLSCKFQDVWEKILWYGIHIPGKSLNLCFFTLMSVSHSKILVEFYENLFQWRQKGWEEAMFCCIKIQSENMKMAWNISLFQFGMIAIFVNVMALATIL